MKSFDLEALLSYIKNPVEHAAFKQKKVIGILLVDKDAEYPLLFFSQLYDCLKKTYAAHGYVEAIDLLASDKAAVESKLATSFLGQSGIYWLKNAHLLDQKKRIAWADFIAQYNGPHTLICALSEDAAVRLKKDHHVVVHLASIDHKRFSLLTTFFERRFSPAIMSLVRDFFAQHLSISFDQASMLINYLSLIGARQVADARLFLDQIIDKKSSLFMLAGHFLAKRSRPFFAGMATNALVYPPQFWLTFWSEQLWRARYYVECMKQRNYVAAKKIGFRLPFSFLQRDWRGLTVQELKKAHAFLYDADFAMKNGSSDFSLDLFYMQFLQGRFK